MVSLRVINVDALDRLDMCTEMNVRLKRINESVLKVGREIWKRSLGMEDIMREYVRKKVAPGYERYTYGTAIVGASERMMIRGGCLPVRTNDNMKWKYDTNDSCICGEPADTERHVLLECMRFNRERMKWSNKWDQEMGVQCK